MMVQEQYSLSDSLTPGLNVEDAGLVYWLDQVAFRLRREIAWCWFQRTGYADPGNGGLPQVVSSAQEVLDWNFYDTQKQEFFAEHPTARDWTLKIQESTRPCQTAPIRKGGWDWLVDTLDLEESAQFVLALAIAQRIDAGLAPVIAHCMNDLSRPYATPALAQRLWDDPAAIVKSLRSNHSLFRFNLLTRLNRGLDWQQPLEVLPALLEVLLDGPSPLLPEGVEYKEDYTKDDSIKKYSVVLNRLRINPPKEIQVLPLMGRRDSNFLGWAGAFARGTERPLLVIEQESTLQRVGIENIGCLAWMRDADVLLPVGMSRVGKDHPQENIFKFVQVLPVRWYMPIEDKRHLSELDSCHLLPVVEIEPLGYAERLDLLKLELGEQSDRLRPALEECARRFRFQETTIKKITHGLARKSELTPDELIAAFRWESDGQLGELAQRVHSRFQAQDLVLSDLRARQFDEVLQAMRSLTQVHYQWGAAQDWNEGGLAVLFCGPPGTGKTMAAEAASTALKMDMYRVDLSQVVNKYIGETEKNLKRIFDAAESSDCILFFDECDALFGKRTEVKDAHDRFANIEISYLLERMERFKGLAILATNRRKDLDEAFMRRLRYIIEFPVPEINERERIWRQGFPKKVDISGLDLRYLAKQFVFSGGHIRSIIFNSCLQAAGAEDRPLPPSGKVGIVTMADVLVQVKRELQKLNRTSGEDQFGQYAETIRELVQ